MPYDVGADQLILPQLLRVIGQPLFTITLSQHSTVGLSPKKTTDASGLSNTMRNRGGLIGIAMLSTMIDRSEQMHFSVLAEAITVNATRTQDRIAALAAGLHGHIADQAAAKGAALGMLAAQVRREAYVMAYADGFYLVGVSLVLSLAVVAILKKPQRTAGPIEAH